jgi:carbon storage regulator
MLILTRKPGESLYIGDSVKVTIVEIKGNQIRVGIDAPADLRIYREEIYRQILEENKSAAEAVMAGSALDTLSGGWKGVAKDVQVGVKAPRSSRAQPMRPAAQATQPPVFVKRRKKGLAEEDEESEKEEASSKESGQES